MLTPNCRGTQQKSHRYLFDDELGKPTVHYLTFQHSDRGLRAHNVTRIAEFAWSLAAQNLNNQFQDGPGPEELPMRTNLRATLRCRRRTRRCSKVTELRFQQSKRLIAWRQFDNAVDFLQCPERTGEYERAIVTCLSRNHKPVIGGDIGLFSEITK
ncbi:hypothetical protein HRR80_006028 [Exophiala dermatitidis]|uniref:Uncharacterized protein n=1 Tax=Exophiala dermatitidis TaxID=5970 RepID=A0AAN6EQY5_EXODE|nr:hypothetical protein HRR80_006028 [Exophiala dermatitidis]